MSDKIGAQSIGAKIRAVMVGTLIGLLVIGFAIWGINDVFSPTSKNSIATIGKSEISGDEFETAFRRELENMSRESGQMLSHAEAYQQGVHSRVLGGLIQQQVINVDADDLGIGVNRSLAREEVSQIPVFVDELTGKFSEQKYLSALAQNRISRAEFEKDVERDLRRAQTVPAIIDGVEAPKAFAELRYKFLTEQRKAKVLTLSRDAVAEPAEPDEATLKSFIAEREAAFTAPEYRRVTMIRVEDFDLTPDITVEEDQIKAAFDYKVELGELGSPETRDVVQIVAPTQEAAQKAAELLKTDQEPTVIASGLGLEIDSYSEASQDDIVDPETAKAAYELGEGDVRTLLGSLGQWYAVKVTKITSAVVPNIDEMKDELTDTLKKEFAQEKLYDITTEIENAMDEGANLEEIAKTTGLPLQSFDYIDRLGQTQDNIKMAGVAHLVGIGADEILLTEIFTNDLGFETDLFETSTGGWAAIRVDYIIDSTVKPFDEVKDQATAMWKTLQIDEAVNELMLDTAGKAQTGVSLEDLAAEIGEGAKLEDAILVRSAPNNDIGPSVMVGLLKAEKGEIVRGQGAKPLTRQIAQVTDIIANADGLAGQFADALREQASVAVRSDLQRAYQDAVIAKNPLQENPEKIRSLLGLDSDS